MTDKKKADQQASPKKTHLHDNSASAGQCRMLEGFELFGQVTTVFAREELGVMHPASRVRELRERGYEIDMRRVSVIGHDEREHLNVASYSLIRGPI